MNRDRPEGRSRHRNPGKGSTGIGRVLPTGPFPRQHMEVHMKKTLTAIAILLSAGTALAEDKVVIEFAYPYSHLFDVTYEKILRKRSVKA